MHTERASSALWLHAARRHPPTCARARCCVGPPSPASAMRKRRALGHPPLVFVLRTAAMTLRRGILGRLRGAKREVEALCLVAGQNSGMSIAQRLEGYQLVSLDVPLDPPPSPLRAQPRDQVPSEARAPCDRQSRLRRVVLCRLRQVSSEPGPRIASSRGRNRVQKGSQSSPKLLRESPGSSRSTLWPFWGPFCIVLGLCLTFLQGSLKLTSFALGLKCQTRNVF